MKDLVDLLMDQAGDLDYQGRRGADHLRASEANGSADGVDDNDVEVQV